MKRCKECCAVKPSSEFYRAYGNADELSGRCKECYKARVRAHRANNLERYRKADQARATKPERVEARKRYAKSKIGRTVHNHAVNRFNLKNPGKRRAHIAVGNALRDGKLTKRPCEVCGVTKVQAHHEDYSKPLAVTWLCSKHHRERHKA